MNKILINISIFFIKIYKYLFSPFLGNKCRFLPSCSDYFIDCLNEHGFLLGLYYAKWIIANYKKKNNLSI